MHAGPTIVLRHACVDTHSLESLYSRRQLKETCRGHNALAQSYDGDIIIRILIIISRIIRISNIIRISIIIIIRIILIVTTVT